MNLLSPINWLIAARNLLQHRLRSALLVAIIAAVTALMVLLAGVFTAMEGTLLRAATTLMSGDINVGGFYKTSLSQSAPLVTNYERIVALIKEKIPEASYIVTRGRGWAKIVSETNSAQLGISGIDIDQEVGFRKIVQLRAGALDALKSKSGIVLFETQAKKLAVKVGDRVTVLAPTPRGVNNTLDVTVVAIAADMGLLSAWNTFVSEDTIRRLYQLNDSSTGVIQLHLKDRTQISLVEDKVRNMLVANGYLLMDQDPRSFFMKFDTVNRQAWTGQKLDVTNWKDEVSFVNWAITLIGFAFTLVVLILVVLISVGISNVMAIAIRERTREIGTLRAVGMQRRTVLSMFLSEGFLLGAVGTILGVLAGVTIAYAITAARIPLPEGAQLILMSSRLEVLPTRGWILFALLFVTGTITLVSLGPSRRAARLKPVTAMSHLG